MTTLTICMSDMPHRVNILSSAVERKVGQDGLASELRPWGEWFESLNLYPPRIAQSGVFWRI